MAGRSRARFMKYDAVVIGDRFAAYATAALLSRRGFSCALVKTSGDSCGRSRFERVEGFTLDFGVLADRLVGISPEKIFMPLEIPARFLPSGRAMYFNGSKTQLLPVTLRNAMMSNMLGVKSKSAWLRAKRALKQYGADPYAYKKPLSEWLSAVPGTDQDVMELAALKATAALDTGAVERISIGTYADAIRDYGPGRPIVPIGGWLSIFRDMESIIREKGDILDNTEFQGMDMDGKRAVGVRVQGETIETDFIAAALPVKQILGKIPENMISEKWRIYLKKLEPVCGVSLHIGLDKRVTDTQSPIVTMEPFTHGLAVSNIEPSLAPRGGQLLTWFIPVPETTLRDNEELKKTRLQVKEILDLLYPGIMDRIVLEQWRALEPACGALPVIGQTREDLPPVQVFTSPNAVMVNDSVNLGGIKGEPALRAALEAAVIAEKLLEKK